MMPVRGPGDPSTVHASHESVAVSAIIGAERLYRAAIERWIAVG